MALILVASGALLAALAAAPAASAAPPASGDWVVTGDETYLNQTIVIEGNVFVRSPGNLTLLNVTLQINSTAANRRGLLVEPGAQLHTGDLDNSTLTSLDRTVIQPLSPSERIHVVAAAGSTFDLRQTALWGVGYTQSPPNASGVYILTNTTTLQNVTVYSGFFGIVFINVVGSFVDITVHNNTYNGIDMNAGCVVTLRGLFAADNGQAAVHAAGGRVTVVGASLLHNGDGLAIKFGGVASASGFDASGNANGFVALNSATLNISSGRVTNNTAAGVDARGSSIVNSADVAVSDNPNGHYGSLGSSINVTGGSTFRGIRAFQLRSSASANLTSTRVQATTGDALDIDTASINIFGSTFERNAFGGQIVASPAFAFLDSTLSNSTVGGFTFTNSLGVLLHNPALLYNRGTAVNLEGSTTAVITATALLDVRGSTVEVDALSVSGAARVVNSTLLGISSRTWSISGNVEFENSTLRGTTGVPGLAVGAGATMSVSDLRVQDASLFWNRSNNGPGGADLLSHQGSGELVFGASDVWWSNLTNLDGGAGVRQAAGRTTMVGGSVGSPSAGPGGLLLLVDVSASLSTSTYSGTGQILQVWTGTLLTQWAPGNPAANQPFEMFDSFGTSYGLNQTDGAGTAALYALAEHGTSAGVVSYNPFRIQAGSGAWVTNLTVSFTAVATHVITLADVVAPAISVTSPTPGARVSGFAVNITGTLADGESGVATLEWSFNNASFTAATVGNPFTVQVPAQFETNYLITLRAADLAGNLAFAQVNYRVDRTAPTVSLVQPQNGSSLRGPTVRFIGGTEVGASLTIDGTSVAVDAAGDFDTNHSLPEGVNVVVITAVDLAGNAYSFDLTLRIDSTPPGIAVFSPQNGSTVAGLFFDLIGFVEPGASLRVNGAIHFPLLNGSFNVSIDLIQEGENRFLLESTDPAGNSNQTEWVVLRDTRPPAISVAGFPGSGTWSINSSQPDIAISTDEYAFIHASISPGGTSSGGSGTAFVFTPALVEGQFTLTVTATDAVGNAGTRTFALRVDLVAPTFALDNRTEGGFVNVAAWTVSLSAEPGANVTVGGVQAAPTASGSSTYSAAVQLQPGPNVILVVVMDAAGNRAVRTVTLVLDQSPPTITITAPLAGAQTTEGQLSVSGDTEPNATVSVMGRVVPVDASGHFATLVNIPVGTTTITFTSTDRAGNTASVDRAVTRTTGSGGFTGLPFLTDNLLAIILLLVVAVVAAALAGRGRAKRAALKEKAAGLERDFDTSRASRNDMNALENFSPRGVTDEDFVSAEDFRRREAESEGRPKQP